MSALPACACGAPAIAIAPGSEPEVRDGLYVVPSGEPMRGACLACWPVVRTAAVPILGISGGAGGGHGPVVIITTPLAGVTTAAAVPA
jgi:hypothetical protein